MRLLILGLVFGVTFALCSYAVWWLQGISEREKRMLLNEVVSVEAAAIERHLSRALTASYVLAQQVRSAGGQLENFEAVAEELMVSVPEVSNLQLAPNGVIEQIYPLRGNERALGLNLLDGQPRNREAALALRDRRLTLAGPFELVQGGVAVIGRNPVFLSTADGDEHFWGFASALIFIDKILASSELGKLERTCCSYEIARADNLIGPEYIFASSESAMDANAVEVQISVPNGHWMLRLSRHPGSQFAFWQGMLLSGLLALLLSALVARIQREPDRLRKLVEKKTEELEKLAFHDPLTGLINRRLLTQELEHQIEVMRREHSQAALFYMDLDDFKRINDSMGHEAGDQLLVEVALRLKNVLRGQDLVARLGGDEYAIMLLNIRSAEDAQRVANKILSSVSRPTNLCGHEVVTAMSIGIAMIPADGWDAAALMKSADLAMYSAKRQGKNQVAFFDPGMQSQVVASLRVEEELRHALEHDELRLHYQPIVELPGRRPVMLEALLRWQVPGQPLRYPGEFIEVAEQNGLIVQVGYWVIHQACMMLQQREKEGLELLPVAINVSPRQLQDPMFADCLAEILLDTGVSPALIELEITESVLMEQLDRALMLLNRLKGMGVGIAIDDFGTGYSSLAQLKELPVDTLKIDRSFVVGMMEDKRGQQIVEAIVAMAHTLGLSVIAEGIEEESQQIILQQYGCDLGQGYFYSKPKPVEHLNLGPEKVAEEKSGLLQD
ncbi:putative bifunctional diguanylate cyclase/phosphodiesterase [Marinobacterium jannaschii]|uniref:putative bifunctional diguanylate cyclase/phosphodiesterase n=1 Tax=Marinobacterium jannaschii TaxID=64970 RepID=UPI001FE015FB|nr:EAL domain-containing protein [Marinobacterium jannaschii]